jgi:shikimate kinase
LNRDSTSSFIVLTGFMGSGKSSVGLALSSLLCWRFVDLDCEIERAEGRKIREIFSEHGEPRFREIETEVLRAVLKRINPPLVLAAGGGTYVQSRNAALLRAAGATVVFLEASAETLLKRCYSDANEENEVTRPLAADRPAFLRLYEQRLPLYRKADLTVDSESRAPEAVALEIAERLWLVADD